MKRVESFSAADTFEIGKELGCQAQSGQVYCLEGELGVGKTVFTQGFASGLGITETVNSPTFTILQEYRDGRMPFYHFDVYRITDVEEMEEVGYTDYFYGDGVCLVEWAGIIADILPTERVRIVIEKDFEKGFDYRMILIANERTSSKADGKYLIDENKEL